MMPGNANAPISSPACVWDSVISSETKLKIGAIDCIMTARESTLR